MFLCQEWRSSACSLSLFLHPLPPLFLSISPTLYFPCTPPYPTVSPLFLFFPSSNIAQMALPYVGILDIPISRSMSNNFLYNFLRLWYSVVTAENWVAEKKCLLKIWGFYFRKRITDRKSSQMARTLEPVSQLQV